MQSFKEFLGEDLRQWFKQKWVRMDTKGNIKGDCARDPGEGKPKCLPQARAHALGKEGRAAAARRKRREDPNPERRGAPINVRTEEVDEACWTGYKAVGLKKKGDRMVPNCVKEDETVTEKWTEKYKRSIDCNNPKGFSQKAHCQGKKKNEEVDLKDRFKKYIKPTTKTTPKIERISNPSGRTTDHVEYKVTEPTGMVQRFKSKREAQAHYDSLKEDGMGGGAIGGSAGPTNVTGVATSTDPISATAVNRKKRKSPVMLTIRRKSPKV